MVGGRGSAFVVFTLLLCLPLALSEPLSGTDWVYTVDGEFHTPTQGNEVKRYDLQGFSADDSFSGVKVDLDVEVGPWNPQKTDGLHGLFWLHRGDRGGAWVNNIMGYVNIAGSSHRLKTAHSVDGPLTDVDKSFNPSQGQTYHVTYVYDGASDHVSTVITNAGGDIVSRTDDGADASAFSAAADRTGVPGFFIEIGQPANSVGPEIPTYGWTYSNLRIEFYEGGVPGGPDLPRADEGVPQPGGNGEQGNLLWYAGPHTIADSIPLRLAVPPNPDGYGQITLSFHMDMGEWREIDPETAVSGAHRIARLDNGCSGNMLFQYDARPPPGTDPGATLIKARGLAQTALEPYLYETGTEYDVTITLDVMAEQITFVLEQDGAEVQRFTKTLNTESGNECSIQHTAEGLLLTLGANGDDTWNGVYAPNGWTFSDIRIDVTDAEPQTTEGADMTSDEGRLAFLAANMIRVAQDDDYTLDCGPSVEVFPLPPPDDFPGCALQYDDRIVFGFIGEGTDADTQILTALQDPAYASMIEDPTDIDTAACDDGYQITELRFQECDDALPGSLTTYAYKDAFSESTFLIISEGSLDALTESTFEEIVAFFRGLFGLPTEGDGEITLPDASIPLRKFHHGYFSHVEDRDVAAAWFDHDAIITYAGFVSDLHLLTPEDGEYLLGDERQVISAELSDQSPEDIKTWRHLTAALRVSDEAGTPFPGDTCGNGVIGFDEQCEVGESITCGDINEFSPTPDTVVECNPPGSEAECRFDASVCQSSACMDTWTPPDDGEIDESFCGDATGEVCRCGTALWNAVDGIYVDPSTLTFGSPEGMFTSHGSENIPLACAAAAYVQSGDPGWFHQYYDWQTTNNHFGSEFFSRVYMYNIMGSNLVVLNEAKQRGQADLQAKAEDWFRATYAIQSVGAVQNGFHPATGHVHGSTVSCGSDGGAGPSAVMPAPRSPVIGGSCSATWSANDLLLAKAAGYTTSGGTAKRAVFWHGLRFPVEFTGLAGKEDGPYPIASTVFEPGDVGITAEDRENLRAMIEMSTFDQATFDAIAAMIGTRKPVVPITWVRTSAGTASWWGVWEERTAGTAEGHNPNGNKPGFFAMKMLADGTMEFLHPNPQGTGHGAGGSSWREGNIIYAENDGTTESFDISDIMAGEMIYIAQWDDDGLHKIDLGGAQTPGACGVLASQGAYDIIGRIEGGVPQIKVAYVRDSPNGDERVCYQDGLNDYDDEGVITFPNIWISHSPGTATEVYKRIKEGSRGHNDLRIMATADATGWTITGTSQGIASPNDEGQGHACWTCSGSYCNSMNIRVNIASISSTSCGEGTPACASNTDCDWGGLCTRYCDTTNNRCRIEDCTPGRVEP